MKELYTALAKAQKTIKHAHKDAINPQFKSQYADLASVIDAVLDELNNNGLCVMQMPKCEKVEDSRYYYLSTTLAHVSGESISFDTPIVVKDPSNPQSFGSGVTYARRYALSALCCIAQDDDDGNNASKSSNEKKTEPTKRSLFTKSVMDLKKPEKMKHLLGQYGIEYLADLPESSFEAFYRELRDMQ